jgi:hypothetical protein
VLSLLRAATSASSISKAFVWEYTRHHNYYNGTASCSWCSSGHFNLHWLTPIFFTLFSSHGKQLRAAWFSPVRALFGLSQPTSGAITTTTAITKLCFVVFFLGKQVWQPQQQQ